MDDESEETVVLRRLAMPDDMAYPPVAPAAPAAYISEAEWYGAVTDQRTAFPATGYGPAYAAQAYADPSYADPAYADQDYADPEYADPSYADPYADPDYADQDYADPYAEAPYDPDAVGYDDHETGQQPLVIPEGVSAEYPSRHPTSHRRERRPVATKHRPAAPTPAKAVVDYPSPRRSAKPAIIVISVVLAVVALVGVVVWAVTSGPWRSQTPPPGGQASDPMLAAGDLGGLNLGSEWSLAPIAPVPGDFACVGGVVAEDPAPRLATRGLTSQTTATDTVIQLSATYADDAQATTAFEKALTLSGTCPDNAAQVTGAFAVSGLADAAQAATFVVWGPTPESHTTLIARTGRTLTFVDVATTGTPATAPTVASASTSVMTRLCANGQGTCPSTVTVTSTVPPAGNPPGWLLAADLPRITPTAGIWGAVDLDAVKSKGSQCDGVVLGSISGTTSAAQRTLLLNEDPKQSAGFGVDEIVYTFAKTKDATTLAKSLTTNISGCPATVPIAKVVQGKDVKGSPGGVDVSGSSFTITHTVNEKVTIFRVSVVQTGQKVAYLIAMVTSDFDFTDNQWRDLALRAGERMTQSSAPSAPPATPPTTPSSPASPSGSPSSTP